MDNQYKNKEKIMDTSVIPRGDYCYTHAGKLKGACGYKIKPCPYWRHRSQIDLAEFDAHNDGYCLFLGKGDIELNSELTYKLISPEGHPDKDRSMTADEWGMEFSTLWDMVKMCNENPYYEENYGIQDKL